MVLVPDVRFVSAQLWEAASSFQVSAGECLTSCTTIKTFGRLEHRGCVFCSSVKCVLFIIPFLDRQLNTSIRLVTKTFDLNV